MLQQIGRYEILELIAAGGQGSVYRARDTDSGEVVALKVMHPDGGYAHVVQLKRVLIRDRYTCGIIPSLARYAV